MLDQDFQFDFDVEVFQKSGDGDKERRIGGFVSTNTMDQQGERIIQSGMDFSHFLNKGWFNDNHSRETVGIVGYPEVAEMRKKDGQDAWYVEGYLLKGTKRADEIWELANALQKSGRRLGYSVEGKIQERRDGGATIAKAIVKNVAITNCPVNDTTSLEVLAKSLDYMTKALTVGPSTPAGPAFGASVPGDGSALMPESLDTGRRKKKKKKNKAPKGLSKAMGVAYVLNSHPELTLVEARRVYAHASAQL